MSSRTQDNSTTHNSFPVLSYNTVKDKEVSTALYFTLGMILTVFCFVGTFFNGMAIVVFAKNKNLRTPTNYFVIALCVCDIFMCIIGMPIPAVYAFRQKSIDSQGVCTFDSFTIFFFSLSSLYILSAISVDRYIVIVKPLTSSRVTQRMASLAITVCFLVGLFWSVMPMIGWNSYALEGIGVACSIVWQPGPDAGNSSYVYAVFVFCFIIPLVIMVFCYANIYKAIRNIARSSPWGPNSQIAQNNYRLERKMLKTIIIMIGAYLISWLPYAVMGVTETVTGDRFVGPVLESFPAILAKMSAVWDPIIYIATNLQFRRAFFELCPCCEIFLGVCTGGDHGSDGSQTVLDPESRAVLENAESERRKIQEVREKGENQNTSYTPKRQPRHHNLGICQDAMTMETKISPEIETHHTLASVGRGEGSSKQGGGECSNNAFKEMPPVEENT